MSSSKYALWIESNVSTKGHAWGACSVMTAAMTGAFSELRRVRGHYLCTAWGPREHWWCITPDGAIVDPTAHQFPSARKYPGSVDGVYQELPADAPEPIGQCMCCGDYCWEGTSPSSNACSLECALELEAEYNCSFGSIGGQEI
jgi:hypothetical protein